jgi:Tat protein translocase TatB subunit
MLNIGPQELLLVLVVALLVVGPRRLPELGRSIGKGLREIRKAQDEVRKTIKVELDDLDGPKPARSASSPGSQRVPGDGQGGANGAGAAAAAAASSAAPPDAAAELSKSLGRSLAELRKARQELQRSFRVDLGTPTPPTPRPSRPSDGTAAAAADPETVGEPDAPAAPE